MSIDRLRDKIRKMKNPTVLNMSFMKEHIPLGVSDSAGTELKAYEQYAVALMDALKDIIPAVRFSFSAFSLMGAEGLAALENLQLIAKKFGYYVFMDAPDALSAQDAGWAAQQLMCSDSHWILMA